MKDLTKGSPAKMMLQFALPVALGNLFQLFYSLADTRVVGSTLGEAALAAVGATTSVSTLFIGFLSGLTNGFALLIAREFGAGQERGVRRYAAGSLFLGAVTACFLTVVCIGGLNFFLGLLNVPDDLMGEASAYIRIILAGLIMTMLYNACAAILRAVGDTAAPQMIYLVTGSHNRIVLDTASMYLKVNTVFYFVPSAISVFRNALQGMGDHTTPVLSSFIVAGKVAVAVILTKILKYWGIIAAEPIVWVLMVIPLAARIRRLMEERI
ncbi:hypothetical protein C0033_11915 [Clostridium sp. chh4-2]|uniref:MATE family efflux transporter n=1 Tax=Clostridium sp. chh4-2 TaxID=2067550 RepID=UPI000CCF52BF|nr:MATE family efflux transporter [Clostridium sp. chh4-2]PNV61943.1 hypothetical protein C0033_11915 [Clostridium sp. chh4-2]